MKFPLITWLRQFWPQPQRRLELMRQYAELGTKPMLLADIALRGGVFSFRQAPDGDVFMRGFNEGRRVLALELIEAAQSDPMRLQLLIEQKPTEQGDTR